MASSADSPEYARQRRQWALWRELLPGIEEFLVRILPQEKLSQVAEERRQYFVERLDILRLPPSLPPRVGKRLSVELLEESEENCGIPADQVPELGSLVPEGPEQAAGPGVREVREVREVKDIKELEKDFAAEQRKISRNMAVSVSSEKDVEIEEEIEESDSAKGVKVYDDIDPTESIKTFNHDEDDDDDINALYEIPVARQPQPPASEDNSLSQPADISSMATANSIDDISDDVLDASAPAWQPPPLPPRTKKKESESAESRVSTNSLEGNKPPELPFRPPLPRRNEVQYARSEKSDKSEKSEKSDVSDGDSTSYESFDENDQESELMSKLNVKLPKRPKKKSSSKASSKLLSSKARSSSTWEINVPFKKLDHVLISGEMLHKGKLSWNRRVVAISNGCMALYKPDKETRPVFVIPLAGFSAYLGEPLGRKGFEMKMTHENGESYTFAVDFKEWVNLWCEHINGISQGLAVPVYHQHLVRTFSAGSGDPATFGSKTEFTLGEEEEGDYEVYEEYNTDSSSILSSPPLSPQTPRFDPQGSLRSVSTMSRLFNRPKTPLPQNRSFTSLTPSARAASTLTLSRWDWKTLFYNLNFPLDHLILGLRRGNLSTSNSNLSLSSDGVESDDSSKPRLRANKVMRMGSFAYRATQFFENLGKKSTSKRKVSSLSSPTDAPEYNLRDGIQEESSLSSASIGVPAVSPSSDATSPVFEDSFRNSSTFSSPSSMEFPPLPPTPPPSIPSNIKHQGYLNIFSSFNKRRWGQRWCLVRENMFECYRTQTSQPCELNFLLKNCILRQAMAETNSPLSLMLLENNKEKITVEPPSKEELSQWLRVLMMETATEAVPPGLEEFFVEVDDNHVEDLTAALEAEYSDIVGASVLKSWEVGSVPILPSKDKTATAAAAAAASEDDNDEKTEDGSEDLKSTDDSADTEDDPSADTEDSPQPDKYLYSTVVKRPSFPTLEQLDSNRGEGEGSGQQEEEEGEVVVTPQQEEEEGGRIPRFTDNLAVYNANKNTTDSGFYSVKEANSDSESGSDMKTDSVSPAQESSAPSASPEESASTVCNTSATRISSDSAGGASGKTQAAEEEEEEENALEKTMTSEDFKDNLEGERTVLSEKLSGGQDVVCSASSAVCAEPAAGEERNNGCENGVHKVSSEQEGSVRDSKEAADSATTTSGGGGGVATTKESHTRPEKVDSQLTNSGDIQQRDKSKKKKKKGKGKKNKPKQQEAESSSGGRSAVDRSNSNPKSQSKPTSDNPEAPGIPVCGTTSADQGGGGSISSAGNSVGPGDRLSLGGGGEPSISTPRPEGGGEGEKGTVPDEDEVIVELKERIGRLREKLVQIKRKREAWDQEFSDYLSTRKSNSCRPSSQH